MSEDLSRIASIVTDNNKEREDGWYSLDEIRKSSPELNRLSVNGLYRRLAKLVDENKLETKMAYFAEDSRWKRVWKAKA